AQLGGIQRVDFFVYRNLKLTGRFQNLDNERVGYFPVVIILPGDDKDLDRFGTQRMNHEKQKEVFEYMTHNVMQPIYISGVNCSLAESK
ncbi:MAG: hypothetical protein AAF546_13170, partial [Verrucomicrobiota bacterium]